MFHIRLILNKICLESYQFPKSKFHYGFRQFVQNNHKNWSLSRGKKWNVIKIEINDFLASITFSFELVKSIITNWSWSIVYLFISIIIIIIMSRRQRGYPWPSLAISPYHSSPPAGLQGYILCPHIVAVCMFVLVVPLLHIHMWGSTGVHRLWARPCFSSSDLRVWFVELV